MHTARTLQPAFDPEVTPAGASSTHKHSDGSSLSIAAPFKYGCGSGLPAVQISAVIRFCASHCRYELISVAKEAVDVRRSTLDNFIACTAYVEVAEVLYSVSDQVER